MIAGAAAAAFHAHLERCAPCADNPGALCPAGAALLQAAARAAVDALIADAAARFKFRDRGPSESEVDYAVALLGHVEARDFAAAHELRCGRRQADWTAEDVRAFRDHLSALPGPTEDPDELAAEGGRFLVGFAEAGGPYPVTEASLQDLADRTLAVVLERRRAHPTRDVPILVALLLMSGQCLLGSVGRSERVAVIRAATRALPVFGFVLVADTLIHKLDVGSAATATKTDAFVAHVGSRASRVMKVRPYRVERGRVVELPAPPDVDLRRAPVDHDPYASVFVSVPPNATRQ